MSRGAYFLSRYSFIPLHCQDWEMKVIYWTFVNFTSLILGQYYNNFALITGETIRSFSLYTPSHFSSAPLIKC